MPLDLVQLLRTRVHLRADARARLVQEVDRLVRQEAVLNVARAEHHGAHQRLVADMYVVVLLEPLLDTAQDRDRVLLARRVHEHRLEASLQGCVLLHVLAVLVQRRCADAVQLSARKHGLEHVAGVGRALGLARPDDGVDLVDEKDDLPFRFPDLLEDRLEPLLELSTVARPCHERRHVKREDHPVPEPLRHVAADNPLC